MNDLIRRLKMKRTFSKVVVSSLLMASLLMGCGATNNDSVGTDTIYEMLDTEMKVGMVTDSGMIDDRAFNQCTWEAISGSIPNAKYLKPSGQTDADYLESMGNLYDAGYHFIVAPGYKFERAVAIAQEKYPDAQFVILDGSPLNNEEHTTIADNTAAIYFQEQEAGFVAAVAAAVELKQGEFGFIGGMKIPSVERYEDGFQQGIRYANQNLGTQITIPEENIVYQGSFTDKAGGQQVAAQMYDKGVDVIFTAAGGTGIGAITEAKSRAISGETDCYVIGVDVDQYEDGIYDQESQSSVILTSAIKKIDQATIAMLKAQIEDKFPGGQVLTFSIINDGVGIPSENPNLGDQTVEIVNQTIDKIRSGEIIVTNMSEEK